MQHFAVWVFGYHEHPLFFEWGPNVVCVEFWGGNHLLPAAADHLEADQTSRGESFQYEFHNLVRHRTAPYLVFHSSIKIYNLGPSPWKLVVYSTSRIGFLSDARKPLRYVVYNVYSSLLQKTLLATRWARNSVYSLRFVIYSLKEFLLFLKTSVCEPCQSYSRNNGASVAAGRKRVAHCSLRLRDFCPSGFPVLSWSILQCVLVVLVICLVWMPHSRGHNLWLLRVCHTIPHSSFLPETCRPEANQGTDGNWSEYKLAATTCL